MLGDKNLIVSEEIVLRHLIPLDASDIYNTINEQRSYLGQWLPFVAKTTSISDTEDYISYSLNVSHATDRVFTIRMKDQFVGLIGFKCIDEANHRLEIGYWLAESYQHRGIMTQSVDKLCAYAFERMNINRIQIKCAVGNTQSANIPHRLNFTLEGIERQGEQMSTGKFVDLEVYSLLKQEYSKT